MSHCRITIATWNIHGLGKQGKKIQNDEIIDIISCRDFIALIETWTHKNSDISVPGYGSLHKHRQKLKKRGRPHGGIIFYYKTKYKNHIETMPCDHEDLMIVRVKGAAVGHSKDLYIFVIYARPDIPPGDHSVFDILETEISLYQSKGDTI